MVLVQGIRGWLAVTLVQGCPNKAKHVPEAVAGHQHRSSWEDIDEVEALEGKETTQRQQCGVAESSSAESTGGDCGSCFGFG